MPGVRQAGGVTDERAVAIWRDGGPVRVPADEPVVAAFDQGLGRGDGVFESIAVIDGRTPYLAAHLTRLASSARLLDLPDVGDAAWQALVDTVLDGWDRATDGVVRLFLTRGLGPGLPRPPWPCSPPSPRTSSASAPTASR